MKLINEKFEISTKDNGEIKSIKFMDQEILHQGEKWWKKTFPIIFPQLSFSTGMTYKGKEYTLPKHGWWNSLEWDGYVIDEKITQMAMKFKDDNYPFSFDINQRIWIEKNTIFIETTITNVSSKEDAYFYFGYHPAFIIDKESFIKDEGALAIDLEGKLTNTKIKMDKLMNMNFGKDYDTLVYKNSKFKKTSFKSNGLTIEIGFDSKNLQLWKPADAEFICIEPWYGVNDAEYNAPNKISGKTEINKLSPTESFKATMTINIKNRKT